jgi:hypothetical protein
MLAKPTDKFKQELEEYTGTLTELLKQLPPQKKFYFYATDAFDCQRKQTIKALGLAHEAMYSEESGIAFAQGHALEAQFVERLRGLGLLTAQQQGIFIESHGVSGKVDLIVFRPEPELYEIKTCKSYQFKQLKAVPWNDGADVVFAYLKKNYLDKVITNYTQLQLYLFALDLPEGYLVYFDKNSGERLDLHILRDDTAVQKALSWFSQTRSLINKARRGLEKGLPADEALPEKLDKSKFPCSWGADRCSYYEFCHGAKVKDDKV